ncbi:MAG TPA: DegT/DnrJ/EryC1/StrS aminotransferase family protein, partial [Geminicoccaceae bacterium]|nr:DegT/DnrJ/EryC1/StrS aminotransferase family protein [Geminicoccaceae bacterium]
PHFDEEQIAAAAAILRSGKVNYWTGEEGRAFEQEFARACGAPFGIALANGTVALDLALHVLGIGSGDEVVVTSRSFIASASAVALCGARPVFADVDPDSQNITPASVRAVLSSRTRAIIAVHLAGWPCELDGLLSLAREHGLKLIEDCAQAHGATYDGRPVGSFGDVAAFSFCQDKIMTTAGEGGLLATADEDLWRAAWSYKDHGKSYDAMHRRDHPPGFRWVHESLGTNWRMTEVQAAIGRRQLQRLPEWLSLRRRNAAILAERLRALPLLRVPEPPPHVGHAWYKFYVFVRPDRLAAGWTRDRVMSEIVARGIPCFVGSCSEIYRERAFADRGLGPARPLPVAEELGATSLMFLVHPTLTPEDMDEACRVVEEVCTLATR